MKSTNSIFWYFSYLLLQKLYTDKIQNFNTIQILQKKKKIKSKINNVHKVKMPRSNIHYIYMQPEKALTLLLILGMQIQPCL